MSSKVYMKIELCIDVDSDDEDKIWRQAMDFLIDNMPDSMNENIINTDFIRAETGIKDTQQ